MLNNIFCDALLVNSCCPAVKGLGSAPADFKSAYRDMATQNERVFSLLVRKMLALFLFDFFGNSTCICFQAKICQISEKLRAALMSEVALIA